MTRSRWGRWMRSLQRKSREELIGYFNVGVLVVCLMVMAWGVYRVVVYAYNAERLEIRRVSVVGLQRVSENEVLLRAGYAPGTNLLRVDLDATREAVEQILWVRQAKVQRVWPDELVITIVERQPIALARIDGEIYQVDADGVILSTDMLAGTDYPILDGLHPGDVEANAAKIEVYTDTIESIGREELSEVHVASSGDVSVVPSTYPVMIDLGSDDHRGRWEKFLRLRNRIRESYPSAFRIDLRFQDQVIIRTSEDEPVGKIIWGEEKKLL